VYSSTSLRLRLENGFAIFESAYGKKYAALPFKRRNVNIQFYMTCRRVEKEAHVLNEP